MKIIKIKISVLIFASFLAGIFGWLIYDSKNYFKSFTPYQTSFAALDQGTSTLQVTIGSSLTLTLDSATVSLGTIVAGTPVTNYNQLTINTNNATGYYITAGRNNSVNSDTLYSAYGNLTIDDSALPTHATNCAVPNDPEQWSNSNSKGLGFSLYAADGGGKNESCWGAGDSYTHASNRYAAFAASASATTILSESDSSPNPSYASVGYKSDVTSAQSATEYNDGSAIYTATTN